MTRYGSNDDSCINSNNIASLGKEEMIRLYNKARDVIDKSKNIGYDNLISLSLKMKECIDSDNNLEYVFNINNNHVGLNTDDFTDVDDNDAIDDNDDISKDQFMKIYDEIQYLIKSCDEWNNVYNKIYADYKIDKKLFYQSFIDRFLHQLPQQIKVDNHVKLTAVFKHSIRTDKYLKRIFINDENENRRFQDDRKNNKFDDNDCGDDNDCKNDNSTNDNYDDNKIEDVERQRILSSSSSNTASSSQIPPSVEAIQKNHNNYVEYKQCYWDDLINAMKDIKSSLPMQCNLQLIHYINNIYYQINQKWCNKYIISLLSTQEIMTMRQELCNNCTVKANYPHFMLFDFLNTYYRRYGLDVCMYVCVYLCMCV